MYRDDREAQEQRRHEEATEAQEARSFGLQIRSLRRFLVAAGLTAVAGAAICVATRHGSLAVTSGNESGAFAATLSVDGTTLQTVTLRPGDSSDVHWPHLTPGDHTLAVTLDSSDAHAAHYDVRLPAQATFPDGETRRFGVIHSPPLAPGEHRQETYAIVIR